MHRNLAIRTTAFASVLAIALACADATTPANEELRRANPPTFSAYGPYPDQPAEAEIPPPIAQISVLRRTTPLDYPEWKCEVLRPAAKSKKANGVVTISLRSAGLKVEFPAGAVSYDQWVCIYAHRGEFVNYEFYPHGIRFNHQIKIQQDLHRTSAYHNDAIRAQLEAGYMPRGWRDIDDEGVASFTEVFPVVYADGEQQFSKTNPAVVKFYTNHFSGYALASGRRGGGNGGGDQDGQ